MAAETGKRQAGDTKGGSSVVGGHVDAACGKCKAVTSHIVLAKVGAKPTRVECRTCHAMHAFRASTTARPGAAKAAAPTPHEVWTESMRRARGAPQPYATSGRYAVGERLKHPKFGEGVVTRLPSSTVCEVVFMNGTVKLIMGASSQSRTPGA